MGTRRSFKKPEERRKRETPATSCIAPAKRSGVLDSKKGGLLAQGNPPNMKENS